jgi:putative oxidoreductase
MKASFEGRLCLILRWTLGVVFIWAAISKLTDPLGFFMDLLGYRLPLPDSLLRVVAATLPWLECLLGLLLLAGLWLRWAICGVLLLCSAFVLCTGQAWVRGLDFSCGCLDLSFLGLDKNESRFFESAAFACLRAIVMLATAFYLLRRVIVHRKWQGNDWQGNEKTLS